MTSVNWYIPSPAGLWLKPLKSPPNEPNAPDIEEYLAVPEILYWEYLKASNSFWEYSSIELRNNNIIKKNTRSNSYKSNSRSNFSKPSRNNSGRTKPRK